MKDRFSHIDKSGKLTMVDVSEKKITRRKAMAQARVVMEKDTLLMILDAKVPKGDVFACARLAGIAAAKRTGELIPLCHPLPLEWADIRFEHELEAGVLTITAEVVITAKTGAEMEALEAVSQAALTVYDMCKATDRGIVISDIMLLQKSGGKSGQWKRR